MSTKITDFLSSFGIMLAGVFLLFFSSVYFASDKSLSFLQLPTSGKRTTMVGGDISLDNLPVSKPIVPLAKNTEMFNGSLSAISAIVLDTKTKTILFKKNIDEIRPLASITKLMAVMVLLDLSPNWNASATITEGDLAGDHHVEVGETFTLDDLWHAALIGSSNTAINALVRSTGLTTEQFVLKMNQKAQALRLGSAFFDEPTGLSDKNVASVSDTARMLIDALKFEKIYDTVQIGEYYIRPLESKKARRIWTTNWLLTNWVPNNFKVENIAGKTGYIDSSRYNFAVTLGDDKQHNIAVVVFGATTNEERFSEARDLAQWTFDHYIWPDQDGYDELVE